jgi:hypothetical protein
MDGRNTVGYMIIYFGICPGPLYVHHAAISPACGPDQKKLNMPPTTGHWDWEGDILLLPQSPRGSMFPLLYREVGVLAIYIPLYARHSGRVILRGY